jgi:cytochrome c-type biogenesis protein CcmF
MAVDAGIPEIGTAMLWSALAAALTAAWMAGRRTPRPAAAAAWAGVAAALLTGAQLLLAWAFVASDVTVVNVLENSHPAKPLLFRLAGSWASHEGSLVLWCMFVAWGLWILTRRGAPFGTAGLRAAASLALVLSGFLVFLVLTSSPFVRVDPSDYGPGFGLNAVLQHWALSVHPPLLFLGYAGTAVGFALAVGALWEGRVDKAWGAAARPWVGGTFVALTLGIGLGSWWAYEELGWGGFWFWDPVENASLLPWLLTGALLHTVSAVAARGALRRWAVLLAIAAFASTMLGSFLVRSGVLTSVHAFALDPARGLAMLALAGGAILAGLALFAWRGGALRDGAPFAPWSREGMLVANNIGLCAVAAVVAGGTVWPLLVQTFAGVSLHVGPAFYVAALAPLALGIGLAMGPGPCLAWRRDRLDRTLRRAWPLVPAAIGAGTAAWAMEGGSWGVFGFAVAAWVLTGAAVDLIGRWRTGALGRRGVGAVLAHAGVGVVAVAVVAMGLGSVRSVALAPGETALHAGHRWTLLAVEERVGPNFFERGGRILIVPASGSVGREIWTARRIFPVEQQVTTEMGSWRGLWRDLRAVYGGEEEGRMLLRLSVEPLAAWLWIGGCLVAFGAGLAAWPGRKR